MQKLKNVCREINILRMLKHPSILPLYEFFLSALPQMNPLHPVPTFRSGHGLLKSRRNLLRADASYTRIYLVMQYLKGGDVLSAVKKKCAPTPPVRSAHPRHAHTPLTTPLSPPPPPPPPPSPSPAGASTRRATRAPSSSPCSRGSATSTKRRTSSTETSRCGQGAPEGRFQGAPQGQFGASSPSLPVHCVAVTFFSLSSPFLPHTLPPHPSFTDRSLRIFSSRTRTTSARSKSPISASQRRFRTLGRVRGWPTPFHPLTRTRQLT